MIDKFGMRINSYSYDDRKQERRLEEYNIVLWIILIEKSLLPSDRVTEPGIEPSLFREEAIGLSLAPPPLPTHSKDTFQF